MVDLGMENKQWRVVLLVDVESFEGDARDIIMDYFGPGEEGPITILSIEAEPV